MTNEDAAADEVRPEATPALTGAELLRWYWLKSELAALARQLGVRTGGGKQELTQRVAAALDGLAAPEATSRAPVPRSKQLSGPLGRDTVIPPGQRSSQLLREFFEHELGPAFSFDARMRAFIAEGGHTLDQALNFWRSGRGERPMSEIGAQFELNAFLRDWHTRHRGGTRSEAMAAWRIHRTPRWTAVTTSPAELPDNRETTRTRGRIDGSGSGFGSCGTGVVRDVLRR